MSAPLLSPATATRLRDLARRGFATKLLVGETVDLVLSRDLSQSGNAVALSAQTVLLTYADRQPMRPGEGGPYAAAYDGEFAAFAPFDVAVGDRFTLNGVFGRIAAPIRERNGIVAARFVLEVG